MKEKLKTEIIGLVNSNKSYLQLNLETVYIGSKRFLNFLSEVELVPDAHKTNISTPEIFELRISIDDNILTRKTFEVDLLSGGHFQLETDLELHNTQYENRVVKAEIMNVKTERINYTAIKEMINIEPLRESKTFIKLDYYQDRDLNHNFSYYTNSTSNRVFMKMNNNSWKEIKEGFRIKNEEVEGAINYIQLYTTDKENTKIYSNVVRFTKT